MQRPHEIDDWDIETLKNVIQRGESNWLEFKRCLRHQEAENTDTSKSEWRHKLETEFTAFANAEGGTIIFGVTDDGSPNGIFRPGEDFNGYFNNLLSDVNPPPVIRIRTIRLSNNSNSDRFAVIVHVSKADNKPVQTSRAAYYIRINESAQPMNREMVQTMYLRSEEQFNAKRDLEIQLECSVDWQTEKG